MSLEGNHYLNGFPFFLNIIIIISDSDEDWSWAADFALADDRVSLVFSLG